MGLKAIVDDINTVEEKYRDLYTERNGKWELTAIEGMRTQADIDRLQGSLVAERNEHKATKVKLDAFDGLDAANVRAELARIPELEVRASNNKLNDAQIETIVSGRVKQAVEPIQQQLKTAQTELTTARTEIDGFKSKDRTNTINGAVRDAAVKSKVLTGALDDVLLYGERLFEIDATGRVVTKADIAGVTAGIEPSVWLTEQQKNRAHWWPASSGGGAAGSGGTGGGVNPFSKDGWNLTEQGRMHNENPAKAEQMAKAAGTTVGGLRPTK